MPRAGPVEDRDPNNVAGDRCGEPSLGKVSRGLLRHWSGEGPEYRADQVLFGFGDRRVVSRDLASGGVHERDVRSEQPPLGHIVAEGAVVAPSTQQFRQALFRGA